MATEKLWSPRFNLAACVRCGRADYPHKSHGLCKPCYDLANVRKWRAKKKAERQAAK